MSLTVRKTVNIIGESKIDGVTAIRYTASIDSQKPESVNYVPVVQNKELYKDNRDLCHDDQAEFEDIMYEMQDEMMEKIVDVNNPIVDEPVVNDKNNTLMEDTTDENDNE